MKHKSNTHLMVLPPRPGGQLHLGESRSRGGMKPQSTLYELTSLYSFSDFMVISFFVAFFYVFLSCIFSYGSFIYRTLYWPVGGIQRSVQTLLKVCTARWGSDFCSLPPPHPAALKCCEGAFRVTCTGVCVCVWNRNPLVAALQLSALARTCRCHPLLVQLHVFPSLKILKATTHHHKLAGKPVFLLL